LASGIEAGGKLLAHAILVGTEKLQKTISTRGKEFENSIPEAVEHVVVPDFLKQSIATVKEISPTAVVVSTAIVDTLSFLAGEISNTMDREFSDFRKKNQSDEPGIMSMMDPYLDDPRLRYAKNVGQSTLGAVVNVWDALEEAGMALIDTSGSTAVSVLAKKYGDDVAETTKDALSVTTDIIQTGRNLKNVGTRTLLKSVATDTVMKQLMGPSGNLLEGQSTITNIEIMDGTGGTMTTLDAEAQELLFFSELETIDVSQQDADDPR